MDRSQLRDIFRSFTANVYFQPPEDQKLVYPCIMYELSDMMPEYADNLPLRVNNRYQVTVMYQTPESDIPAKVAALPMCRFDRHYAADHLNHDVFNIFF